MKWRLYETALQGGLVVISSARSAEFLCLAAQMGDVATLITEGTEEQVIMRRDQIRIARQSSQSLLLGFSQN